MENVELSDVIEFMQHLKRGFDKDLFQSKIEELAYVAESTGIESHDFHALFKLWLNLSIPIAKWISLGACLVPQDRIQERTVDYAFRWLLANCEVQANFSRVAFLLDWLTAAMDSDSIDMKALDSGYEIFYSFLSFELLTSHSLKLVYSLTKPNDVTRKRVVELLDYAKKREGKKNMFREIQVLLGLFKSYRPECVPENVPATSIHTSFKKINANLLARFKKSQERRHITTPDRHNLMWINPLNYEGGKNKKGDPLVPNLEFTNLGSKQYCEKESLKSHHDFSDPVSLVQQSALRGVCRPARLRALLANQTGLVLLALASDTDQAFLSHDLHHLLTSCFLEPSSHSDAEKADLLNRLGMLQHTLLQGIPVITRFLAQFLPFWNERDYFSELLSLCEWVCANSVCELQYVVRALSRAALRAEPLQQCALLRALTNMYCNLVFSSTRSRQHFKGGRAQDPQILSYVATSIADLCHKGLQVNPEDMRVVYGGLRAATAVCAAEAARGGRGGRGARAGALPRPLTLALPLLAPSAAGLDKLASLLLLYREIFSQMKSANLHSDPSYLEQRKALKRYTSDFLSCVYSERALCARDSGLVLRGVRAQVVAEIAERVPEADAALGLRAGLAFAPYTYLLEAVEPAPNKFYFDTVINSCGEFNNLKEFLVTALPELR